MKHIILPVVLVVSTLLCAACTKTETVYVTRPAPAPSRPAKYPANYSPAVDGFQAVTKPTSYSSY